MARAEAPGSLEVISPCCPSWLPLAIQRHDRFQFGEGWANLFTCKLLSVGAECR